MSDRPRSYLVLASQRSGSTLLVESLRATGIAGEPHEFFQYLPETSLAPQPRQWFAGVEDESVLELLAPLRAGEPSTETAEQWRDRIRREGRSSNGIWGGKLMWNQTPLLLDRAAGLPERSGTGLRAAIVDVLGEEPLFVHVHRPDKVHQAVSFWRAVQTRVWRAPAARGSGDTARYHVLGIAHLLRILKEQDARWREWFAAESITPLEVNYRDLAADSTAAVGKVLLELGLDPSVAPAPVLERQADVRSNTWVERFLIDAAEQGIPL
ncbi:trehalose 2-sulfotransferase [Nocardia bovistercoris]|uniref:Trehalose 2-sulfotransferase n=1 Tax=Nocardia bovistercoris TaxID=2785916 RepID=A0A931IAB9_9NOCA|nr:Stf0 family sulfotransferase [Nocardia bovistercoris]MBH0776790.1 sulfotransferase [Nocardia bovistercoris]